MGVFEHGAHGAPASGHIPDTTRHLVHQHRGARGSLCGQRNQFLIATVHNVEERVGPLLLAEEQSVELDPFGPCYRRFFHVVGTLDERDAEFAHLAITAIVVERRKQDGIGMEGEQLLDVGAERTAYMLYPTLLAELFQPWGMHKLHISHTH